MHPDDIVYVVVMIFSLNFGMIYRKIPDGNFKRYLSTAIGFGVVAIVSGIHVLHLVFVTLVNAYLILYTSKKSCHKISFAFTFLYLLFFRTTEYFGIPYAPAHTNLIQMLFTLKLVGLAFEVHDSHLLEEKEAAMKVPRQHRRYLNPDFMDIIHYSFCYVGILTGPYYSYRTYYDFTTTGFHKVAQTLAFCLQRIKLLPIFIFVFFALQSLFVASDMDKDEFYTDTSFLYRFLYMFPVYTAFRMRLHIAFMLSECACMTAGLGAYPTATKPKPGVGPSADVNLIDKLAKDPELTQSYNFDFTTIQNVDPYNAEFAPSFREEIKHWNMCVQYWLAHVVYKRFPFKPLRTLATFVVSAFWHGMYLGHYCTLIPPPFYLMLEGIYEKLLDRREATGMKKKILDAIFWVAANQAFPYMGIAFSLLTMTKCIRYYRSIYFVYHIAIIVLIVVGVVLLQVKKSFVRHGSREKKE